jgi:hypothetical protein
VTDLKSKPETSNFKLVPPPPAPRRIVWMVAALDIGRGSHWPNQELKNAKSALVA